MASATDKIREVLARYDVPYEGNVWAVQGTPVIKHMALELVAARAEIEFDKPTILRAERDEAVILVAGHICAINSGSKTMHAWSIGEALVNVNYKVSGKQAAYVYAMAEKRAKDRVILKLVGLHGQAYSEDEADDFKQARPTRGGDPADRAQYEIDQDDRDAHDRYIAACQKHISAALDPAELRQWWASDDQKRARRDFSLTQDEVDSLKTAFGDRLQQLAPRAVG